MGMSTGESLYSGFGAYAWHQESGMKPKNSELWQRLRTARLRADKTQKDVAKEMGVSRPAVTLWESENSDNRTTPSTEQLKELSRIYGRTDTERQAVFDFLLDDSAVYDQIEEYRQRAIEAEAAASPASYDVALLNKAKAFWSAVKFAVLDRAPAGVRFDVPTRAGSLDLLVPMVSPGKVFSFTHDTSEMEPLALMLQREVGNLLTIERALGGNRKPHLLVWSPRGELPVNDLPQIASAFGVEIVVFGGDATAIQQAVDFLSA